MRNKIIHSILALILFVAASHTVSAATYTITTATFCSTIGGAGVPLAAGDVVRVKNGATLTVDGTYSCTTLTLGSTAAPAGNGTLAFNNGSQLTVSGVFTIGASAVCKGTINMTSGGKLIMANTSSFGIANAAWATLTPGLGTINIAAAMTLPTAFTTYNNLEANSAGTINLGANTICNGSVNVLTGTLHTNAASNWTLSVGTTFTVAALATFISNNSAITCNGAFNLNGTYTTGTGNITIKGNFVNNGTYTVGTGTTTFGGTTTLSGTTTPFPFNIVQVNAGSTLTLPASVTVTSNWINNGGNVVPGTGLVAFTLGAAQSIGGTAASQTFYNLTVNKTAGTLTFAGSTTTLNANTLTLTLGGFTACANINLTGNFAYTAGTFTPGTGKITFNGGGAQTLPGAAVTFNNIEDNKTACTTLTQNSNCTISGVLTMTEGIYDVVGFTITAGTSFVATGGDIRFSKAGISPPNFTTYSLSGGTVTLNRNNTQTLRPGKTYYNVVLDNTLAKTMAGVTSILNNLTLSGTATMTGNAALTIGGTLTYSSSGSTTLTAATNISMGSFIQSGGTLIDNGNTLTVTGPLWSRTAGTFTATGKVDFTSTSPITLSGPAVTTFSKLFKTGSGTLTASVNSVVSSELNISSGTFDVGANSLTGAAAVNMSNGTLSIATTGTTVPALSGAYALTGGTVLLNAAGSQTVRPINYYNLNLTSGTKTFNVGTTGIAAALLLTSTPTVDLRTNSSILVYNGTTQNVQPLNYFTLQLNAGTKTFLAGTTAIGALFTLSGSPTVDLRTNATTLNYDGTGANANQTIQPLNHYNLTFGATGTKTFATGTSKISGAFTSAGASSDATTNSTSISYDGGTQSVLAINYYNLDLTAGTKTVAAGTTGIAGTFTLTSSPTVDLRTNSTTVSYNGTGAQNIQTLDYQNLSIGSSGTKTFSGGTTKISGDFTSAGATANATTNSTSISFDGAGTQSVLAINYYNLDFTAGTKTLAAGTTGIAAALTLNASPTVNLRTNSTTVSYNGTGSYLNQTIAALNYHHLNFGSSSGIKTFPYGTTKISGDITTSGATGDALTNSTIIEFDGTAAQAITGSAIPSYYDITNSNTAGLTSTGSISLFNTMTLSANSIYTNSGTLTFKSDITSTARLAEVPASAVFNGNISMQKLVPAITPSAGTDYFHIMGSPVAGSVFSAVAYDETNTGTIDAGFPCTTCLTALSVGQGGFRNLGANEILFNYPSSPPNIGTKVVNTSFTASGNSLDDGWNLVSNPYPCEIFWSGATLSNVAGTAYLWNGINYDEYLQADGLSIPSGQGFWVKATGSGSVTFHESDKVVDDNPIFLRHASAPDYPKMVLKLSGNGSFDLADLRFNPDATAGFDPIYDAYKLNGNTNAPRLSSYNSANEEMSINSMPELNQNYDIPMVARCIQSGAYQISVESLSGFPSSACIFLEDLVTGSFYDLRSTSNFDITLLGSTTSTTRFILHIGAPVSIQVTDASCNNGDYTGSILAQGQANGPWTYTWQDAAGNVIHTATNSIGADSITNVPSGSYTLLIQSSTGNCTSTSEDITLGGFAPIDANALIASPTCFGDANGSIQLNAAGGNGTLTIQWDNLSSSAPIINNLTAGTYPLTISDAAGCSHHETIEITQPAEIMAACTASSNLLYLSNGGWVSFTNQSTGATSYRWNFGDGSAEYTGNTAAHQYTTAGAYTVTLTAINGTCESSFSIEIQVEQAPTGLVDQTQNEELQINAANGIIHCHFNFATEQVVTIAITNMLGQEVYSIKEYAAYNNNLDIKPQGSANGVYLVHLSYAGHLQTKKIFLDK